MKVRNIKSLIFAVLCGFYAVVAGAATSLFSDYGQIQNVQNYSTNPFWSPTSPYNKRLPQPVYVQGADLNAGDCMNVVQSLVSVQCMARDNCKDTALADVRPAIMVQLSNLPGHNYVSACSGYIDGVFEEYVSRFGNQIPNRGVAFPTATVPNTNVVPTAPPVQIQNPYEQTAPQWQTEIQQRADELQSAQNNNPGAFPETIADFSFSERMANATTGYLPYKDKKAYQIPNFIGKAEYCNGAGKGTAECDSCNEFKDNPARYDCCVSGVADWKNNQCICKDNSQQWDATKKQCVAKPGSESNGNNGNNGNNQSGGNGGNGNNQGGVSEDYDEEAEFDIE